MNGRVRTVVGFLFLVGVAAGFVAPSAWAADAWQGSGGRVPAWTKSRTVTVSYHARYDLSLDGGTHLGTYPAWIDRLAYALGTSSSFSPTWINGDNQTAVFGNPVATIHGTDTVTVSRGDGKKTVYALYRVYLTNFQAAQPVSPLYQARITLDTHGPTTLAPSAASCRKGTYVTLQYRVNDKLSPKARVTILIKRGTTIKKTLALGLRPTGKLLGKRFKCKLARGRYAFVVKAKDLAGNPQGKIGRNTLTVT